MNTETVVRPKLHHYGLLTANLDAMIDWYGKVLGMTINHRSEIPAAGRNSAPFSGMAFVSNDEINHRIVFFEKPQGAVDPDQRRQGPLQHIAFAYESFDDLLGTYARLKGLGILPSWAADHGVGTAIYYQDPDQNIVELNVNNYGNEWTATEHMRTAPQFGERPMRVQIDPEKIIAARKAGASSWELHERAFAREFAPAKPYEPRALL